MLVCVLKAKPAGLNYIVSITVWESARRAEEISSVPITPGHLGFWQLGQPIALNDMVNDEALRWQLEWELAYLH